MKPLIKSWIRRLEISARLLKQLIILALVLNACCAHAATLTVTSLADTGPGTLRQLTADATSGDIIVFSVTGTIKLTSGQLNVSKNLTILGPGASAMVISGDSALRVIYVHTNVSVTLSSLTIADGFAPAGAGIYNAGGTLVLHDCTLTGNSAAGPSAASYSGNPGTNGWGGAVYNGGLVNAINCTFVSNSVTGGAGGSASWPSASGGMGADGGGGAFANFGTLLMTGCLLSKNSALGGRGGEGMSGFYGCPGEPGGAGGNGGFGHAGALFNGGQAWLVNNTLALNTGTGGAGGQGGSGGPPSSQSCPTGNGGHGGAGASGFGAIYDVSGQCYLTNCTVASNLATPGLGGSGGPAGPSPYPRPGPIGSPGENGSNGAPGSALRSNGAHLLNTLVSANTPTNCLGILYDDGCNLSSDASAAFTAPGSLTNVDPKLGPLSDNGGPTMTLALLPFSPAIDSGCPTGSPATDQRGIARPQGGAPDIGAYEYQFAVPQIVGTRCLPASNFWFEAHGLPNGTYVVQTSTNLTNWADTTNVTADSTGVFQCADSNIINAPARFYRLKMLSQ